MVRTHIESCKAEDPHRSQDPNGSQGSQVDWKKLCIIAVCPTSVKVVGGTVTGVH